MRVLRTIVPQHTECCMIALYNFLLPLLLLGARIAALFNSKIRRGIEGRKSLLDEVREHYENGNVQGKLILIHVASFGELEQAKPVIAALKAKNPRYHIHLTFFSPSGYENAVGKYTEPTSSQAKIWGKR